MHDVGRGPEPLPISEENYIAELLALLTQFSPRVDRDRLRAVFQFAATAHRGQFRKSGEAFISHPASVCMILGRLLEGRLDTSLACAAILHDVVEDTPVTVQEIEKRFGHEIASLVEGATKLAHIHFKSAESAQADYFRRMLLSMARDLRVVFIKLADRLHNIRTVHFLSPESQKAVAVETLNVYAPLAHRLGIASVKREMEDLSNRVLWPEVMAGLEKEIDAIYRAIEEKLISMRKGLEQELRANGIKAEVQGRRKHLYSVYQKIWRRQKERNEVLLQSREARENELINMNDLMGLRIITTTDNDCYRALGVVHSRHVPVGGEFFKDYIATPKSNLYQSLHTTVLTEDGEMVEVQIRTWEMHRTAETGVAAHYVYKQGGRVDEELDAKLGGFVAQTADWQRTASDDEYMDFLRTALYQEEVFAYTPRRELKRLAKGSTPLDFAFQIHTEVGQHTVGARVNGELVPLRYEIRNGDMVEIITSAQAQPHEDWLQIVRTANARSKIRHWLRQRRLSDSVDLGREMLERELKRGRHKFDDKRLEEVAREFGCEDLEQLYGRLAEGQVSMTQVMRKLVPEKENFAERLAKGPLEALGLARKPMGGVRIHGIDNMMLSFARCCQPVPGDRVIGIITMGRGVSVHRQDCPNTFGNRIPAERKVTVEWDTGIGETFPVRLVVYGADRTSLLADIAKAIAATTVNIRSAGMASEDRTARGVFVVEVPHLSKLNDVMNAIRRVSGVSRVERRQRLLRSTDPPRRASGDE